LNIIEIKNRIKGNVVPVPAQYNRDLSINHEAYKEHVQFLVNAGIKVFYLAMSASEFDFMSVKERVAVTKTVASSLDNDCILLAQALGGHWIDDQIDEAKMMLDSGAHAIVVAPHGIKEGNKFFSSFYSKSSYDSERHDDFFFNYMETFSIKTHAPIVYHDKPFKSGKGPSMSLLLKLADIENIVGLKEHVSDPLTLKKIYSTLGDRLSCYDGFGKTIQFWSLQWGATARHTCWSWFDPKSDIKFVDSIRNKDLKKAADIINTEWPIAEAICSTGFQGYKYIMELCGLPAGPVRIPGKSLSEHERKLIQTASREIGIIT